MDDGERRGDPRATVHESANLKPTLYMPFSIELHAQILSHVPTFEDLRSGILINKCFHFAFKAHGNFVASSVGRNWTGPNFLDAIDLIHQTADLAHGMLLRSLLTIPKPLPILYAHHINPFKMVHETVLWYEEIFEGFYKERRTSSDQALAIDALVSPSSSGSTERMTATETIRYRRAFYRFWSYHLKESSPAFAPDSRSILRASIGEDLYRNVRKAPKIAQQAYLETLPTLDVLEVAGIARFVQDMVDTILYDFDDRDGIGYVKDGLMLGAPTELQKMWHFYVTASEAQLAQFVEGVMDEAAANAVINDQEFSFWEDLSQLLHSRGLDPQLRPDNAILDGENALLMRALSSPTPTTRQHANNSMFDAPESETSSVNASKTAAETDRIAILHPTAHHIISPEEMKRQLPLPVELLVRIISFLPRFEDLGATILTHSSFYNAFQAHTHAITHSVAYNTAEGALPYAIELIAFQHPTTAMAQNGRLLASGIVAFKAAHIVVNALGYRFEELMKMPRYKDERRYKFTRPLVPDKMKLTPPERRRFRRAMYRYWTFCEQWKRGGTFGDFVQLLDINDVLEMVGAARFLRDMAEIMFYDYAGPCIFSADYSETLAAGPSFVLDLWQMFTHASGEGLNHAQDLLDDLLPSQAVFFFFDYEEYADARGLSVYWDIDRKNAILDGDHEELVVILKTSLSNEASSAAATA